MDFKKARGGRKQDSAQYIDASPNTSQDGGAADNSKLGRVKGAGPRSIQDTQLYQEGVGNARRIWFNYVNLLKTYFKKMTRPEQIQLITRLATILSMGSAVLILSFFYSFLPTVIRVFALPAVLVVSWWAGQNIVANVLVTRFETYLNKES